MKFLLVLALALVAASAEEKKEVKLPLLPYAYAAGYYNHVPTVYNNLPFYNNYQPYAYAAYNPVQIKPVEKEYEVLVKKVEFVEPETACKNHMGALVPCKKAKRSAEEEEKKAILPLAYNAFPYTTAFPYYNNFYNSYPLAYSHPVVYHTAAGCQNAMGQLVPCAINKRSADEEPEMKEMEEEKKAILPLAYTTAWPYAAYPYYNNFYSAYNTYPQVYNAYPQVYSAYNTHYTYPLTYAHTFAKRSAEEAEEKKAAVLPLTYNAFPYSAYPYSYNYGAYPYAYNFGSYPYTTYSTPVVYKAPEPIVKEVEVLKPVYKEVVEKVELKPLCRNAFGLAVPCADNE